MESEKPDNFEYSQPLEQAKESQKTIEEIDKMIAEAEHELKEVQEHRTQSIKDNEWAKQEGLPEIDISKIDSWIAEVEQVIEKYKKFRVEIY